MTAPGDTDPDGVSSTALDAESPKNGDVPSGNLFGSPKLTSLDPADQQERKDAERLLETLERDRLSS